MAVDYQNSGVKTETGATSSSFSFTNAGNGMQVNLATRIAVTSPTCTFNSVSLTLRETIDGGNGAHLHVFTIASDALAQGANTVAVGWTNASNATITVVSVTGANVAAPHSTIVETSGTAGTASSVDASSIMAGGLIIDALSTGDPGAAPTVGADQTQRQNTLSTNVYGCTSTQLAASAGVMSWTFLSANYAQIAVPWSPASPAGGAAPIFF